MRIPNVMPTELRSILRLWLVLLASTLHIRHGSSLETVSPPSLDLASLGRVGLVGNFDAISVYTRQGQSERSTTDGRQSILTPLPNGDLANLASADAHITAMCPFVMKSGDLLGVVVGGNFTSLGGVDAQGVALFNPQTSNVTALPGLQGTVSALLCDQDTNSVYVGGSFKAANSTNAIAWVGTAGWTNLPFAGFNAPVTSITKAPNGHIVFGGSFSGLGNTTTPATKDSQLINLDAAKISTDPPVQQPITDKLRDPRNIVCPPNATDVPDQDNSDTPSRTFLLADNRPSFWQADMAFGYIPSKLRLWNTHTDGRGTNEFRFTALPNGGIMNLTFIEPSSGKRAYCDSRCSLNHNASNPYQDFSFVNPIGMSGFRVDVSTFFGAGGGFNGIEIFENEIWAYAVNDFNEPSCADLPFGSNATATGPWARTPSGLGGQADYLTANIASGDSAPASVVFKPDIKQAGNYTVTIYTPGCQRDNTCASRGIVNITANLGSSGTEQSKPLATSIYQTNINDKYDQVFMSYVATPSDSFRPAVTLTPIPGEGPTVAVAARVKFELIDSTGGLNGLFEYDPDQAVVDMDFSKSAINRAGTELESGARVSALITHGDAIFAGGDFSDDVFDNIMQFRDNNASSLSDSGLNGPVTSLYTLDDTLYLGGSFTNVASSNVEGLNNIAAWSYSQNKWIPLGAGVDGTVDTVVPFQVNVTAKAVETAVAFSGSFQQTLRFGSSSSSAADGFAVWVPSQSNWLQNLNIEKFALDGQLSTFAALKNGTQLLAGTLESRGQAIGGAVLLESSETDTLRSLGINVQPTQPQKSLRRRALTDTRGIDGVVAGYFYDNDHLNVTILAGHFAATATSGSTVNNLAFLNASSNNQVTGLASGINDNATFLSLDVQDKLLFAGGSMSGQIAGAEVAGVISYDLSTGAYGANQPPALAGPNVIVNSVATRPDNTEVYVGGSFDTAGSIGCPSVCAFQTSSNEWMRPGTTLGGVVSSLAWTSSTHLIAAGNLTINGNSTFVATYDTKKQEWTAMSTDSIPGPVTAFTLETSDGSRFWVAGLASNGSTFLMEKDGNRFKPAGNGSMFGANTNLRGLQVLSLRDSDSHDGTDLLDGKQALLATGQLNFTAFGYVSAAVFNGTDFTPFILSTTANGDPGSLSQLFSQNKNKLPGSHRAHSKGIVILVALCAALGCIFLIILVGIILDKIQRRRAGYTSIPSSYADKQSNIGRVPPQHLLAQLGRGNQAPTV